MKKIIKFITDAYNYVGLISFMVITGISSGLGFAIAVNIENVWYGLLAGIVFFLIIMARIHSNIAWDREVKEHKEMTYGDDPEWKKYKELKKKFRNS